MCVVKWYNYVKGFKLTVTKGLLWQEEFISFKRILGATYQWVPSQNLKLGIKFFNIFLVYMFQSNIVSDIKWRELNNQHLFIPLFSCCGIGKKIPLNRTGRNKILTLFTLLYIFPICTKFQLFAENHLLLYQ